MTTNIYVLRLSGGNWYIGKTNDVSMRYQEHVNGDGSAWTSLHTPICLAHTLCNVSPFEEDKVTKEYMAKYGIEKVRGGSYSNIHLNSSQTTQILNEIKTASDMCYKCGKTGHYANVCSAHSSRLPSRQPPITCYKCGNIGHYANTCSIHTRPRTIRCYKCGNTDHCSDTCYVTRAPFISPSRNGIYNDIQMRYVKSRDIPYDDSSDDFSDDSCDDSSDDFSDDSCDDSYYSDGSN